MRGQVEVLLGELFLDLKKSIEEASLRTLALRDLIGTFSTVLSKQLLTLLAAKLLKLGKIDFAIGAEEFRDALAEVEQNISQTKNEIDKHLMFKALGNGSSLVLILESWRIVLVVVLNIILLRLLIC